MEPIKERKFSAVTILVVIFVLALGFGVYKYVALSKEHTVVKTELSGKVTDLETKLAQTELEKTSLSDALYAEQSRNEEFEDQIREITGTIGTLEKLSKTDPELLKKYSKVYFLNEHYEPAKVVYIDPKYVFDPKNDQFIHSQVKTYLKRLQDAAATKNLNLKVLSAFRSFGTQAVLKSGYSVTYGSGTANQFSADQGYSEHQLGTTVDFTSPTIGGGLNGFQNTEEYKWLVANAYKYGFVLSYPEGNAYYQYEPWHWRFVGVKLARELHEEDLHFYDMDQREIDKYLINLFD